VIQTQPDYGGEKEVHSVGRDDTDEGRLGNISSKANMSDCSGSKLFHGESWGTCLEIRRRGMELEKWSLGGREARPE